MNSSWYNKLKPLLSGWFNLFYKPTIEGVHNVPSKGSAIIACNHTSILDPILILSCNKRMIHFLAKDELIHAPYGFIFKRMGIIPVNRREKDPTVMPSAEHVLSNDGVIGIFPEGTVNRTDDVTLRFKTGAVRMAIDTNSVIVPAAIKGGYHLFGKRVKLKFGIPYKVSSNDVLKETEILRDKINKMIIEDW